MATRPISFIDAETQRFPFPAYAEARAKGPVYFDERWDAYVLLDYDCVRHAAADTATFSSASGALLVKDAPYQHKVDAIYSEHGVLPINALLIADPPLHSFHRSLVDKAFTISRVRRMTDYLQSVVDGMIDEVIGRGEVEFVREIAMKIPTFVIADQIGLPSSELTTIRRWADAVIRESDPSNTEEEQLALTRTICDLQRHIIDKANEYRTQPTECMLSDLVRATDANGVGLGDRELVSMVLQILVAGTDTTTSVMSTAMYRIMTTPGLEEALRADPTRIDNFIEEMLRYESPIQTAWRRVMRDVNVGGTDIPKGAMVILRWGAANRDPDQFADPDQLDAGRKNARQHLAFGSDAHFCVGNQLARGELRIAFNTLLRRMRNFRLARGEEGVRFQSHVCCYGVNHLEMTFDRN
jgi:cytochrome P450